MDAIPITDKSVGLEQGQADPYSGVILDSPVDDKENQQDPVQELARIRGWTVSAMKRLGCDSGFEEVRIPMRDGEGAVCGWKRRRGDNRPFGRDLKVKSMTEKHSKTGLFLCVPVDENEEDIWILEGEADCLAALTAGAGMISGTAGANIGRIAEKGLRKLCAGKTVRLAPHGDPAGEKWEARIGATLAGIATILALPLK